MMVLSGGPEKGCLFSRVFVAARCSSFVQVAVSMDGWQGYGACTRIVGCLLALLLESYRSRDFLGVSIDMTAVTDERLMVASWRPAFVYHYCWAMCGPINAGTVIVSAGWIALVLLSIELGCKLCINIAFSSYVVGIACCLLECGRFPQVILNPIHHIVVSGDYPVWALS